MNYTPLEYYLSKGMRKTQDFGWRIHPVDGIRKFHYGIDLGGKQTGWQIPVPYNCVVTSFGNNYTYGNWSLARSVYDPDIYFFWGHMFTHSSKIGDKLNVGDTVGLIGNTGVSTGTHLHFEVRDFSLSNPKFEVINGRIDPAKYFEYIKEDDVMQTTPVVMDGRTYEAFVFEGRTYVILRPFAEALGADVQYQGSTAKGTIIVPPKPETVILEDGELAKMVSGYVKLGQEIIKKVEGV